MVQRFSSDLGSYKIGKIYLTSVVQFNGVFKGKTD